MSLPLDYQGKVLTIAQSFPTYTETGTVKAWPASVRLYCGYAYESELISESFRTALLCGAAFLVVVLLLVVFLRGRDPGLLCLAAAALCWMGIQFTGTSFFWAYFGDRKNAPEGELLLVSAVALAVYLTLRAGAFRRFLWGLTGALGLCVAARLLLLVIFPYAIVSQELLYACLNSELPVWLAFGHMLAVLTLGVARWRKETWFYRCFTPLAFAGIAASWLATLLLQRGFAGTLLQSTFQNGLIGYVFYRSFTGMAAAVLVTVLFEAVRQELDRRMEQQLVQQRQEMTRSSYENILRQHEEVMMLRHDMARHFRTLQAMSDESQVKAYQAELIGQNEQVRAVVRTGNETLDILLNSKLSAARSQGVNVEIQRAHAPARIPMTEADLCSMMINVVDNAVTATRKTPEPYMLLDVHVNNGFLAVICENNFDAAAPKSILPESGLQAHGLGLKIIENTVEKYQGVMDT